MSLQKWEHFFKPEVRSSGGTLVSKDKVFISSPSDTEVTASIRVSPPLRVTLKSDSVASRTIQAQCNCPPSKKGVFCKHIWATLQSALVKYPDFFESKTELEKTASATSKIASAPPTEKAQAYEASREAFKEKQAAYRKEQYQKQKERMKAFKKSKTDAPLAPVYSEAVEKALTFFSENGIELREALSRESVAASKKKLARIFHPDTGGSHDEILILNKHTDALVAYLNSKN